MAAGDDVTTRLRAALVDDSSAIRVGLPVLVPEADFVSIHSTVEDFLAVSPDVDLVMLDLKLSDGLNPVIEGGQAIAQVARRGYPICLYTDERRRLVLAQCIRLGALGIVHKADSAAVVWDAMQRIAQGEAVITQSLVGLAELVDRRGGLPTLTARQRQVLNARARGEPWARVAQSLYITEGVAREHLDAAVAKFAEFLTVSTPAELAHHLGVADGDLLAE